MRTFHRYFRSGAGIVFTGQVCAIIVAGVQAMGVFFSEPVCVALVIVMLASPILVVAFGVVEQSRLISKTVLSVALSSILFSLLLPTFS